MTENRLRPWWFDDDEPNERLETTNGKPSEAANNRKRASKPLP